MIPGIDVSHLQQDIDWLTIKKAGFRFAFYKATEFPIGKSEAVIDPQLANNAAGTASNRIHAAPCHFFRSHLPGEYQAIAFIEMVRDLPFSLTPVLALDQSSFRGRLLCNEVMAFLLRVDDAFKTKPIICTSAHFWREFMIHDHLENVLPFVGYPLWLRQHGFSLPKPLFPFPMASFWRYLTTGRIPGMTQTCGLDYFMGDEIGLLPFLCLNRYNDKKSPAGERLAV